MRKVPEKNIETKKIESKKEKRYIYIHYHAIIPTNKRSLYHRQCSYKDSCDLHWHGFRKNKIQGQQPNRLAG